MKPQYERLARWIERRDHLPWSYIQLFDGVPEFVQDLKDRLNHHPQQVLNHDCEVRHYA